jgi:hypothetical protein
MHQLIVPDLMIIQMLNGFGEVHKVLTKLITIGLAACRTDHLTVSYLATYINVDFVDLFSATDVRAVFQKKSGSITDLADYRYWITNILHLLLMPTMLSYVHLR